MNSSQRKQVKETLGIAQKLLWEKEPGRYFQECLKIEHKGCKRPRCEHLKSPNRTGYLWLNRHQQKIQDAIDKARAKRTPVRVLILKPRQTGISTISCANLFHSVRFGGGTAMVVSKDLDSSEHIFSIIQRFYYHLPKSEKKELITIASNRKELKFDQPHGGRILVETAGKTSAGHSFTIRNLLLSEVSRWPEGCEDTVIGLLNAIPHEPDTTIIVESVANGMSGWFYQEWHREVSDYVKLFLASHEHDEYQMPLPIERKLYEAQLEPEERKYIANHDLSLEQIEYRRWAIREKCRQDQEKFKEQYPYTAREAFIASGNTFFHIPTIEAISTSPGLRCDLRIVEDLSHNKETKPFPNKRGLFAIWSRPQPRHKYVIGADVAEGIEVDGAPADDRYDYSSADILDRNTGEQVAHFHGKVSPDEFGRQLALIGDWYNKAFIGVETNAGYGNHVIDELIRQNYSTSLLYHKQILDERTRRPTKKRGWVTTKSNRRSMMSALDTAIRNNELFLNSDKSVDELKSFITKPDGKITAGNGRKDDCVFSLAIANQMLSAAPAMFLSHEIESKDISFQPVKYKTTRSLRPSL